MKYLLAILLAVLLAFPSNPSLAQDQELATIDGRLVNGTQGYTAPAGTEVSLLVASDAGPIDQKTVVIDPLGRFLFQGVPQNDGLAYALTVIYNDVTYNVSLDSASLSEPVELVVYETTHDTSALSLASNTMIIGWADSGDRVLGVLERVNIHLGADRVFVPEIGQGTGMDMLRFSLPPGYTDLEVMAELVPGQLVPVDKGFVLNTPVPPGTHELLFTYLIPYEEDEISLRRSFPFGVGDFSVHLAEKVGRLTAPAMIEEPTQDIGETTYQRYTVTDIGRGDSVALGLKGLPQPSLWERTKDSFTERTFVNVALPLLMGLLLIVALVVVLARKRRQRPAYALSMEETDLMQADAFRLVRAIAELDRQRGSGLIAEGEHARRRSALKARLLEISANGEADDLEGQPNP